MELEKIILHVATEVAYTIDSEHTDGNETLRLDHPKRLQYPQWPSCGANK